MSTSSSTHDIHAELEAMINSMSGVSEKAPKEDVKAEAKEPEPEAPPVHVIPEGHKAAGDIFPVLAGTRVQGIPLPVYSGLEGVPEVDPGYIWPKRELIQLVAGLHMCNLEGRPSPVALIGAPGCGKTVGAEQLAALLGMPYLGINGNSSMEPDFVLGSKTIEGGDMSFLTGMLPDMLQKPSVIAVHEASAFSAAMHMAVFQQLFEKGELTLLEDKRTIKPHPHCILMITDNSFGTGDNMDLYAARNVLDSSTLNRIRMVVNWPNMSEEDTAKLILYRVPEFGRKNAEKLAKLTCMLSESFQNRNLPLPFSSGRNAVTIAKLSCILNSVKEAFTLNYVNALPDENRPTVNKLFSSVYGIKE